MSRGTFAPCTCTVFRYFYGDFADAGNELVTLDNAKKTLLLCPLYGDNIEEVLISFNRPNNNYLVYKKQIYIFFFSLFSSFELLLSCFYQLNILEKIFLHPVKKPLLKVTEYVLAKCHYTI